MRNRLVRGLVVLFVGAVLLFATRTQAKSESQVHEIPDAELTSDGLIDVLKPPTMRGIDSSAEGKASAPKCDGLRQRAIDASSVADIAAIQVTFAFNSAELTPPATANLTKVGQALKSSDLSLYCFRIEGHADSIGGETYNQALSEKRAAAVVRYLAGRLGVNADHLIAVGYGETKPVADNETDQGRQRNRRVQIVNLGDGAEGEY